MNEEQYSLFLKLNDEATKRANEIFKYAKREDKCHPIIDAIYFEKDTVRVQYGPPGFDFMEFPSELVFHEDWRNQYDSLAEKKRQEVEQQELEKKVTREARAREARYARFLELKAEFEG